MPAHRMANGSAMLVTFSGTQESNQTTNIMNDIIKDFRNEGFTLREFIKYGIIAPLGLIAFCLLASFIQTIVINQF